MKVLIACEESQAVCKAFRSIGHEAYSCDVQECSGGHPEWHIQGDAIKEAYSGAYDLMVAHPPCTYLSNSGVCHLHTDKARWEKMRQGAEFFKLLLQAPIKHIAVENPIMHKYAREIIGQRHTQCIQPWQFGHMEQKATCLWLKNLPPLCPTKDVHAEMMELPDNERQRLHYLPPGPERAKERSKTFDGIAQAMAQQWGKVFETQLTLF